MAKISNDAKKLNAIAAPTPLLPVVVLLLTGLLLVVLA